MAAEPKQDTGPDPDSSALEPSPSGPTAALTDEEEAEGEGSQENRRARRAALAKARKQRLRERRDAEAVGLDTQEVIDEALVRSTDTAAKWIRRHSTLLQGIFVAGLVGWAGWGGYGVWSAKVRADASDAVARAIASESGRIGDPETAGQPDERGVVDPAPVFKDDEARLAAAQAALSEAAQLRKGSGTALYAQLALASVKFDQGKLDEALADYQAVAGSDLAGSDVALRARALEGAALVQEKKGDLAGALERIQKLVALDKRGISEPALLEQARLEHRMGKTEEAKGTLKKLREKLGNPTEVEGALASLQQRMTSLTEVIDPEAAKELNKAPALTPERLKELQEQVQKAIGNPSAPSTGP